MRKIKFRAFDKENNEMFEHDFSITSNGRIFWINSSSALDGMFGKTEYSIYFPVNDRFVLMEYVGVKDKNGQEIYTGYIVKTSKGDIGIVKFYEGYFVVDLVTILLRLTPDLIVLGNMYENPELLEDK